MRKCFFCFLFVLSLKCCNAQGRCIGDFFTSQRDSLDKVQPVAMQFLKPLRKAYVIKIHDQQQFDKITELIKSAIDSGHKIIEVEIGRGVFHFHENHITLNELEKRDVSVTIRGKNTVITSDEEFTGEGYSLMPWGELSYADSNIEVVDWEKKLCFVPYKNNIRNDHSANYEKIQITQWFRAPTYAIENVDDRGVYFIAPEVSFLDRFGRKEYNLNYDFLYAGLIPRFRLYNKMKERNCVASCFLKITNSSLGVITLDGINFKGNKDGSSLIYVNSVKALQVMIRKCTFDVIRSKVVDFINTDNVVFDGNSITNTAGNELSFTCCCNNVRVTKNVFNNCGTKLGNTMCVCCSESEYYIAYNSFCNFGYAAIGVGVWRGFAKKYLSKGIVEHNEIYFTPIYLAENWKHMLMDSGAIYIWTQNDGVIIRYNYIHDYSGAGDNKGIFCDDGANNMKIYGNVVLNTPNSFAIDSRCVKDLQEGCMNNANNFMAYNIVGNGIRFQGYSGENRHCYKGANYVLKQDDQNLGKEMDYDGLELIEEDVVVDEKWVRRKLRKFM